MSVKITVQKKMVNVDAEELAFSYIKNLYTTGNGCGLQLSERLEHKCGELLDILTVIADKICELQEVIELQDIGRTKNERKNNRKIA